MIPSPTNFGDKVGWAFLFEEQAILLMLDHLAHHARVRSDDRHAAGEGFGGDEAESLVVALRRPDEKARAFNERGQLIGGQAWD